MTPNGQPNSTFWPANAILLAAFLLVPRHAWWKLVLAVLPAHLLGQLQSGVPVWTALGWFITNSAEGLIGALCITKFTRQESRFNTVRGVFVFIFFGVLVAPLATSFLDAAAVVMTGWGHDYWPIGAERFWTNALAELTIVPAIVLVGLNGVTWIQTANPVRRWEAALLGISSILVAVFLFRFYFASGAPIPAVLYIPLPLLLWSAARFRLCGLSLSLLCIALVSMWYTMHGRMAFPYASMQGNVLSLQILFCTVAVPLMFLSALMDEASLTQESLRSFSGRLIIAQEQERSRIGRELHDDINQQIALLAVELQLLQTDPADVPNGLQELQKKMARLADDVRALSHKLHSSKLDYLGAVSGMRSWCKEFGERQQMVIDFQSDVSSSVPSDVGMSLFRVLQEALHNASKYSGVKRIEVQLREMSNEIRLMVTDLGKGFDVEAAMQGRGLGLTSMQERVRLLNGRIEIKSKTGAGTTIHVHVPFRSEHTARRGAG
jgi:signal transduction histidine kinase